MVSGEVGLGLHLRKAIMEHQGLIEGGAVIKINEPTARKLLGLELIRFISAFAVLMWHYQHFAFTGTQISSEFIRSNQPFYESLQFFYAYGGFGVQIFWCISGFIFFYQYRLLISKKLFGAKKFFIYRFSRLYPLHFATLLVVATLQWAYLEKNGDYFIYASNNWAHFMPQLFLASNWGGQGYSFNGPIWSISVEVLVYWFFFLALRFLGSSVLINLAVLLICYVIKAQSLTASLIVDCLAYFYLGGTTAIIYLSLAKTAYQFRYWLISLLVLIFMCLSWFCSWIPAYFTNPYIVILCMTPFALYCLATDFRLAPKLSDAIEIAGNMTYSSYLMHFPVQLAIVLILSFWELKAPLYNPFFFLTYMGSMLLISYLVYRFFEAPAQNWIRQKCK